MSEEKKFEVERGHYEMCEIALGCALASIQAMLKCSHSSAFALLMQCAPKFIRMDVPADKQAIGADMMRAVAELSAIPANAPLDELKPPVDELVRAGNAFIEAVPMFMSEYGTPEVKQ